MTTYYSTSEAFDAWRSAVSEIRPGHDEEHVLSVWNTLLLRSQFLANLTPIKFSEIATILINHTLAQMHSGVPLTEIEDRLPSSPKEYFSVLAEYLGLKYDPVIDVIKAKTWH